MHREMRALRSAVERAAGLVIVEGSRLEEMDIAAKGVLGAYDRRPKNPLLNGEYEKLHVARDLFARSGDVGLLTDAIDEILLARERLNVSTEQHSADAFSYLVAGVKPRKVASIVIPQNVDGQHMGPEMHAIKIELAATFGGASAAYGHATKHDGRTIEDFPVIVFDVELADATGENDLRKIAARAARSFRQPGGIAIRLPDGTTYRIDAEGVAR